MIWIAGMYCMEYSVDIIVGDFCPQHYKFDYGASCIIKTQMLKIENTSEYNKTTDWQVSKNLIEQRGIYNEV